VHSSAAALNGRGWHTHPVCSHSGNGDVILYTYPSAAIQQNELNDYQKGGQGGSGG
jgi:hypothetical protein